jgi:hypothetical protein
VTGYTASSSFPAVNALQPRFGGYYDAFVAKLNPAGSGLVYSTFLGSGGSEYGAAIVVDSGGNAYVTGNTASSGFPTVNALQPRLGGSFDAFVAKLNIEGSALVYSTYLGGSGDDSGYGIAVDTAGNAYVAGRTSSSDFPTVNALQPSFGGGDAFVAKISQTVLVPTTTTVTSSANPSVHGQPVTFTATVSGSGATPTGTVTFRDGARALGTRTLNEVSQAALTIRGLSVGTHSITATYGGDDNFQASTSSPLDQTVKR